MIQKMEVRDRYLYSHVSNTSESHNCCYFLLAVLFIDGEASLLTYQTILNSVTIEINNVEPDAVDRIVCFTIFDGVQPSDPTCVTLQIMPINDNTPSFSLNATLEDYIEGGEGLYLLEDLEITDADHPDLFPMQNASVS